MIKQHLYTRPMQVYFTRHFFLCLLAITSLISQSALAGAEANQIHGLWINSKDPGKQKFVVMVEDCGSNLCGSLYWLKKPLSASGQAKRDKHNPNEALRDRPLCGLQILTGFQHADVASWGGGEIYNPDDGLTFSSSMKLSPEGTLKIRGYVGISLFGKTLEWVRPTEEITRCK